MVITSSPFARVLVFYEMYKRMKLLINPADLIKIWRKYKNKQSELVVDLIKKYEGYEFPSSVHVL